MLSISMAMMLEFFTGNKNRLGLLAPPYSVARSANTFMVNTNFEAAFLILLDQVSAATL